MLHSPSRSVSDRDETTTRRSESHVTNEIDVSSDYHHTVMTHSPHDISRLLSEHGLAPRRAFGQNFVVDPNTVRRIARLADVGPEDFVIEIGAGLGSLTLALAETGAQILALEIDRGLVPVLRTVVAHLDNVTVLEGDALAIDWPEVIPRGRRAVVVANLPYNVATPLIADLLDTVPAIDKFVVMVQREVALRFAAAPGSPEYGAVSVKIAYWATARLLGDVPATVFLPRPKVTSSLVEIVRRPRPAIDDDVRSDDLFSLVRTAFGQRRKMLRRSLAGIADSEAFHRADIAPTARPEELDIQAWGRLARAVHGSRIVAPAKLTLSLRIVGVRDDGYHLIDAEMVSLDLCDELQIRENLRPTSEPDGSSTSSVEMRGPFAAGIDAGEDNLVHRALRFVGRHAHVVVTKNIPHGGGLGGGSTDAAAVLRWAGRTSAADIAASAVIGADVPFCVRGGHALVRGIGDDVTFLDDRALEDALRHFTLVVPPLLVSTPAVYRAWDDLGGPRGDNGNDLEPAAIHVEPRLALWRDRIQAACGRRPTLAGSGATWFVDGHHPHLGAELPDAQVRLVSTRPANSST